MKNIEVGDLKNFEELPNIGLVDFLFHDEDDAKFKLLEEKIAIEAAEEAEFEVLT